MQEEQYQWQIVDRIQMGHSSSSVMANNLTLTWNTLYLESMSQVVKSQCYITLKTCPWKVLQINNNKMNIIIVNH